jgi:hypothetical protein
VLKFFFKLPQGRKFFCKNQSRGLFSPTDKIRNGVDIMREAAIEAVINKIVFEFEVIFGNSTLL